MQEIRGITFYEAVMLLENFTADLEMQQNPDGAYTTQEKMEIIENLKRESEANKNDKSSRN